MTGIFLIPTGLIEVELLLERLQENIIFHTFFLNPLSIGVSKTRRYIRYIKY